LLPSNPHWSPETAVSSFDGHGPHAEILTLLEDYGRRDLFLNVGYSRFWQRHWGGKAQHRLVDRLAKRLKKYSKLDPVLLDVGCGRGGPAIRLRQEWDMDVTGVDLSERNVEMARRKTRDLAIHEGLLFRKGDAGRLPFEGETFSLVTAIESLAYIRSKRKAASEIQRVLKPGGAVGIAALLVNVEAVAATPENEQTYLRFLEEWDFHDLGTEAVYRSLLAEVGLRVERFEDATASTLKPHRKKLKRLAWSLNNPIFYRIIRWFFGRKSKADLEAIRTQVRITCSALDKGLIEYGLMWAKKPRS
jgi:ubiquinone/menaquinone biosynthesis C-methylase UbiE